MVETSFKTESRGWGVLFRSSVMGIAASMAVVLGVNAQSYWSGWSEWLPGLTKEDMALAETSARDEMTGKPIGTVLTWQNQKTGNSGTVQLVSTYKWEDYSCRKIVHTFNLEKKKNQRWESNLCLVKGKWKWPTPPKKL